MRFPLRGARPVRLVGVTGGIATGKSLVTSLLRELGAVTFSADEAARAVVAPGGSVLNDIVRAFGPAVLNPSGALDRVAMAARIFAEPAARAALGAITHPAIRRLLSAYVECAWYDLSDGSVIALEIPLLYEGGMQTDFDAVVVASVTVSTQIERLRARDGIDESEAIRRIQSQLPLDYKTSRADYIVNNDETRAQSRTQLAAIWGNLTSGDTEA